MEEEKNIRKELENEPLFTDRADFFKMFKSYLTDENVFIRSIGLNANWGEGKSFFINKLSEDLSKESMSIVFNAWKYDKFKDPLHALIAFINDTEKEFPDYFIEIKEDNGVEIKSSLALSIPFLTVSVAADKDINSIAKGILDLTAIYDKLFDQILNKIDYLFIDELDRCNPEFAFNIIELLKHFCIDSYGKTKLIFAFDKIAIGSIIKARYGDNNISNIYLQKILEVEFELPKTNSEYLIKHLITKHFSIKNLALLNNTNIITKVLLELINHYNLSVREIIDLMLLLNKKGMFTRLTQKNSRIIFRAEYVVYICLDLYVLLIILKNKYYEKYLFLIKTKDFDIIIKEIDSIQEYRNILEKSINFYFNSGENANNLTKKNYDEIIYIIFLGGFKIPTDTTSKYYDAIKNLTEPFDPTSRSTFIECASLFDEL